MPQQQRRKPKRRSGPVTTRSTRRRPRGRYGVLILLAVVGILLFALSTAISAPAPTPAPSAMSGAMALLPGERIGVTALLQPGGRLTAAVATVPASC